MKPNDTSDTIHTKRHTSANDTHIAWNKFWILPRGIVCPCPFVRAPSPCKEMNCIPPARPPPHILAPSRSEPVAARTPPHFLAPSRSEPVAECLRLNACFHRHTRTHTHTHTHTHPMEMNPCQIYFSKGMSSFGPCHRHSTYQIGRDAR